MTSTINTEVIANELIQAGAIGITELRSAGKRLLKKHQLIKVCVNMLKKDANVECPEEALHFAILGQLLTDLADSDDTIRNDAIRYIMDGRSNLLCIQNGLNPNYVNEVMVAAGFLPSAPKTKDLSFWRIL